METKLIEDKDKSGTCTLLMSNGVKSLTDKTILDDIVAQMVC